MLADAVAAAPASFSPMPSGVFRRGTQSTFPDAYQAAIVAACILRDNSSAAKTIVNKAAAASSDPVIRSRNLNVVDAPYDCGDVEPWQIAVIALSYVAGPGSNRIADAVTKNTSFLFDPSNSEWRVNHPGGTVTKPDGSRGRDPGGLKDGSARWDVMLPIYLDLYADRR